MSLLVRTALVAAAVAVPPAPFPVMQQQPPPPYAAVKHTPYAAARPVLDGLRPDLLPEALRTADRAARAAAWPGWAAARDRAIRARLALGDDDAVVNFVLYGATFTGAPRPAPAQVAQLARGDGVLPPLIAARIDDFIGGLAAPAANERLRFARAVLARKGHDPDTDAGRRRLQRFLAAEVRRGPAETIRISEALDAALARNDPDAVLIDQTAFRDRGLASDTTVLSGYAVERTLEAVRDGGLLASGAVRRAGLIGPGLDFTDKDAGYDFYPQQSIQPFALLDALARLRLASPERVALTTFDVNPRINDHLEAAAARAAAGAPYRLALPRNAELPWNGQVAAYWAQLGDAIGRPAGDVTAPPNAGNVHTRGVAVRPEAVLSVVPRDLNIVLQRLSPLPADERFDLIVATDVLVYYDVFEQSLALANVAAMLRPDGIFISNTAVVPLPGIPLAQAGQTRVSFMPVPGLGDVHDILTWYRRE